MRSWAVGLLLMFGAVAFGQVVVASTPARESTVVGAVLAHAIRDEGQTVTFKSGLGDAESLWVVIQRGDVDLFPTYTGVLWRDLLHLSSKPTMAALRAATKKLGIGISDPLGFDARDVLVMSEEKAAELKIRTISDLAGRPQLLAGPDKEFLSRPDGWEGVTQAYGLEFARAEGVDPNDHYAAVLRGDFAVTNGRSTDPELASGKYRVLEDDRAYFPDQKAIVLFREDTPLPALTGMRTLEGKIDDSSIQTLNAIAVREGSAEAAARAYFGDVPDEPRPASPGEPGMLSYFLVQLELVAGGLLLALALGLPLGIVAARGGAILVILRLIFVLPALAILALVATFMGTGAGAAIVTLLLIGVFPIAHGVAAGLREIPRGVKDSAEALALSASARLTSIYLPMASRKILAGIRIAALVEVGTATLAALGGAGGLGVPILEGLQRGDTGKILEGAVPAAILALLVELLFIALDRCVVPKGLRVDHG